MSYSGGSNFRSFVILLFRGVFFFDNGRKKKMKSNLVLMVALVLESGLYPVLLEDSYRSQVPLSPRNIHICKVSAGKVKCNSMFFGLQIESREKVRVIRSRLPPSLMCSLLTTRFAL